MDRITEHRKKIQEYHVACENYKKNKEYLKADYHEVTKRIDALYREVDLWTGKVGNIQETPRQEADNRGAAAGKKMVPGGSYCIRCGNFVGENRFCTKCGSKVKDF